MKKRVKIHVKKLKGALGETHFDKKNKPLRIHVDVKKHKGDKAELASTIKHELMHVQKPHATEKQVYKATAKTKISPQEQDKLIAKLRMKKLNYKSGAIKRKFKMKPSEKVEPGTFIRKANEQGLSKRNLAIRGLI